MIEPTPSDLLNNVAGVLRKDVVPIIPEGEMQNQVKAAAVIIRRIAKIWDLIIPSLQAENRDIEACLSSLPESIRKSTEPAKEPIPLAPRFTEVAAKNRSLQEELLAIQEKISHGDKGELKEEVESLLRNLHRKNLERERLLSERG